MTEKLLLTTKEVAELTGFSEGTLRHWVSERRIKAVKLSARCVRFRRKDIEEWIESLVVEATGSSWPEAATARGRPGSKLGGRDC
jgi:excisionase family DNA binding protein